MSPPREPHPTDVTNGEWWFPAPYLALVREGAGRRVHDPREVLNAVQYLVKSGGPWRMPPNDLPPRPAAYQ